MGHRLTAEQIEALRSVPLGDMPNKLRVALGMTKTRQSEVSEETRIAQPNLSGIVNGRYGTLRVDTARKIAEFFGCAIEDLFPEREAVAK